MGAIVGLGRGAVHAAQGLAAGAEFVHRVMNPGLELMRPPGMRVSDEVLATAKRIADYSADRIRKPSKVVEDAKRIRTQMRRDLDPTATPAAPTFAGELRRNFEIGQNWGELAFNVGSLFVGGPGAKAVGWLAEARTLSKPEKFIEQGFSRARAEYLAKPYTGKGHHSVYPERSNASKNLKESAFSVVKPYMSRGDFYELHKGLDEHFWGAGFPNELGRSPGWSAKKLGFKEYTEPKKLWFGTPGPLKARIGGTAAALGGWLEDGSNERNNR